MKTRMNLFKIIAKQYKSGWKDMMSILPNPNLMIATIGDRQATLENIATDAHVASCIQSRKSGILSQTWEVQPNPKIANEINELVSQALQSLNLFNITSEILDAPFYGFQVMEIVWKPMIFNHRNVIVPLSIKSKPQKWFFYDSNGIPRFKNLQSNTNEILLPFKFLIIQHQAKYDNPYGEAILSRCLWPLVFKKVMITYWAKFGEKFGMPHFLGKTDSLATKEDFQKFEEMLDNLLQDGSAVISKDDEIEILNATTANSANIFKDFIDFCNAEISKSILSQTLTTEIGNVGSYAASQVHAKIREDIIKSDKLMVEEAINKIIRWIVDLNYGKQKEYPKFIIYEEEDVDKPLAETVELLKRAGIQVLPPFITRRFGLKEDEFKLIDPQSTEIPTLGFAEQTIPDQDIIDAEIESIVEKKSGLEDILNEFKKYLAKQHGFETAIKNVFKIFPRIKTKKFENELMKRLFAAYITGRLSVNNENGENQ